MLKPIAKHQEPIVDIYKCIAVETNPRTSRKHCTPFSTCGGKSFVSVCDSRGAPVFFTEDGGSNQTSLTVRASPLRSGHPC
jgi:hypothetical protein